MTTASPALATRTGPAPTRSRWPGWALAGICVVAGALYAWTIGTGHFGNSYYSAAVESMTQNFTNFLFGAFDPDGFATVDKPPMALWPQVFSVLVFGYHGWALLLPQVLEGVAAVFLLHRTVRRWAGERVALLAALAMALTPITVAVNQSNNTDTLLVLLLVAAAYALTRSVEHEPGRGRSRWLFGCAFLLGCGFLTKMLQAWIVVPGFALAFLVAATGPARRRLLDLAGAAVVLVVSSFWWVALHDWWPGPKPYVAGSTDGSAWDLVFGYNGFGRVFGQEEGPGGRLAGGGMPQNMEMPNGMQPPQGHATISFGAEIGPTRMFGEQVGGQISWLLPLALLALAVVSVAGVRRLLARRPGCPRRRLGWFLWGGWLLVTGLVFSYAQGVWHEYYTTMLAPPVAAITAAGLAVAWRWYRNADGVAWLALPAAIALTAAWAFVVVSRAPSWHGWTRWAALATAAVAVAGLVLGRLGPALRGRLGRPALVAGIVAALLTPGVWSAATAAQNRTGGVLPVAGPRPDQLPGAKGAGAGGARVSYLPGGGVLMMVGGGPGGDELSGQQRAILDYVRRHGGTEIDLAVNGANAAASYLVHSDAVVIGMGGFMGNGNEPSPEQLAGWVGQGRLRYVLSSPAGSARAMGDGQADRQQWIERNCAVVDPAAYGGKPRSGQRGMGMGLAETLYDCG